MNERLVLVKGTNVSIVAQDVAFGDAESFAKSRQDPIDLALIGAYGNKYDTETVAKYMPEPSLDIDKKKIFTIIANDDGRYLGDIRLVYNSENAYEIGILIIANERSNGFGSEVIMLLSQYAFKVLNANRVYLRVYKNNPLAKELYLRLGFQYEKTIDDWYTVDGVHYLEDWLYLEKH